MRERHSNQKHHEMKDFKQTELFKWTTVTLPGSFVLWFAKYRVRKGREREGRGRGEGGEREGRGRGEGGEREGRGRGEGGEREGRTLGSDGNNIYIYTIL